MSSLLIKLARPKASAPAPQILGREERLALHALRTESQRAGKRVVREHAVNPSLALHVMRRDGFRCRLHDDCCGALQVVPVSASKVWQHKNDPANLVTTCTEG